MSTTCQLHALQTCLQQVFFQLIEWRKQSYLPLHSNNELSGLCKSTRSISIYHMLIPITLSFLWKTIGQRKQSDLHLTSNELSGLCKSTISIYHTLISITRSCGKQLPTTCLYQLLLLKRKVDSIFNVVSQILMSALCQNPAAYMPLVQILLVPSAVNAMLALEEMVLCVWVSFSDFCLV